MSRLILLPLEAIGFAVEVLAIFLTVHWYGWEALAPVSLGFLGMTLLYRNQWREAIRLNELAQAGLESQLRDRRTVDKIRALNESRSQLLDLTGRHNKALDRHIQAISAIVDPQSQ